MDRCPNCGAQIRSGARFCTTCGYRLSDAESTASPVTATATEPAESTEAANPAPAPTMASASDDSQSAAPELEAAPTANTDASNGGSGTWPTSWGSWPSNQDQSADAESPADDTGTESSEPAGSAAQNSEAAADQATATQGETAEPLPNDRDVIELGPAEDETATATDTQSVETAGSADETAAPAASQDQAALDQALSLLDQLRAMLPDLAAAKSNDDAATIADELTAAQSAGDGDDADKFAGLRQTIASAREQPRDIETALHLVANLDAIAALQERYDQLTTAIDRAVAQLRNQQGAR